jgi:hypothetical protein
MVVSLAVFASSVKSMFHFGPTVVLVAPVLAILVPFVNRRLARYTLTRACMTGGGIGLMFVVAYAFSPPVLERIGHELGWPGTTLRIWERITYPVYQYCCTAPWFWKVFVIWDQWFTMMVDNTAISWDRIPVGTFALLLSLVILSFRLKIARKPAPVAAKVEADVIDSRKSVPPL